MATNIQRRTVAAAEAHHLPAIHMAREVAHLSTPAPPAAKLRRVPPAMAAAMDPSRRRAASRGAPRERRAAPRGEGQSQQIDYGKTPPRATASLEAASRHARRPLHSRVQGAPEPQIGSNPRAAHLVPRRASICRCLGDQDLAPRRRLPWGRPELRRGRPLAAAGRLGGRGRGWRR